MLYWQELEMRKQVRKDRARNKLLWRLKKYVTVARYDAFHYAMEHPHLPQTKREEK